MNKINKAQQNYCPVQSLISCVSTSISLPAYFSASSLSPLQVRVSTKDQSLDLQLDALRLHGCQRFFTDTVSGAKAKRPGLDEKRT